MSSLTYVRNETAVPTGTLAGLFTRAVDDLGDAPALRRFLTPDTLQDISYAEAEGIVSHVVAALDGIGLSRGDRAAILSENRPEWALADYGCLCAGIVDVPIYSTLTAPQVAYILKDSGSGLVFVSTGEQMAKVVEAREECAHPVQIVVFDPPEELPEGVMDWAAFMEKGAEVLEGWEEGEFRRRAAVAAPDDLATVLYTSGTTGTPKGVMLSHNNIFSNVEASDIVLYLGEDDETLNFLPLSHILQRMVDYLFFSRGCTITYARSMLTVVDDMQVVRPTVVVSVPRLYEKIYNGVMEARGVKARIVAWAVGVADRAAAFRLAGGREGGLLRMQYRLADKLVFSKVRAAMGGRIRYFVSGGAPLAPDLNRFFYSIGITILEGYGLTETSPVTNVNTQVDFRIGTVGKAVPGTEIRIADDGEILIRGPQVMLGYYFKPEATAEAIDEEKWFHTGDIGELDEDGFLRITDRKKDIIVTAAGKNVAPQPIENRLKANPFIEQAVMVGDRRRFVSLLVVPSFVNLEAWAAARGVDANGREALLQSEEVKKLIEGEVQKGLHGLASFETPKKIALLQEDLTIQNGCLTPTLKVKRRVVQERWNEVIEALYNEGLTDTVVVAGP